MIGFICACLHAPQLPSRKQKVPVVIVVVQVVAAAAAGRRGGRRSRGESSCLSLEVVLTSIIGYRYEGQLYPFRGLLIAGVRIVSTSSRL